MRHACKRRSRWSWSVVGLLIQLSVHGAWPVDVVVAPVKPQVDGVLGEWGAARAIDIAPAGRGVGLRGAFDGIGDHWASVLLMWDADSLYIAASVIDDVLDRQPIAAGDNAWDGPGGERKDKMFYYDHLKVFLRGPEQPLGFNIWLAPNREDGPVHAWGGQQRGAPSADLPLHLASQSHGDTYSYEMALPWEWLRIVPRPDMELDALFLFPDSDMPDLELRKKVAESNKWIWWQGKVVLRGKPPGLRDVPASDTIAEIVQQQSEIVVPKVAVPPRENVASTDGGGGVEADAAGRKEQGDDPPAASSEPAEAVVSEEADAVANEGVATAPPIAELRARLNRNLLGRSAVYSAPAWVVEVAGDELTSAQMDSLYFRFGETIERISRDNISSRSDGLIMDMAEYAGVWRAQARSFVRAILGAVLAAIDGDDAQMGAGIARAAAQTEIEEKRVRAFVRNLCREALNVYEKNRVVATGDLVDKARRKAGIASEKQQPLLEALLAQWRP